ncbi:hypothetical protein MUP77_09735 [Candidatus Bathyarchaeota archaeon]|nr:hypothetical protein [Candidatus Bathyarchaeota archaeon]
MTDKNRILNEITRYYLTSHDFNGIPIDGVKETYNLDDLELLEVIKSLVREGKISLNFGDRRAR